MVLSRLEQEHRDFLRGNVKGGGNPGNPVWTEPHPHQTMNGEDPQLFLIENPPRRIHFSPPYVGCDSEETADIAHDHHHCRYRRLCLVLQSGFDAPR